MILVKFQQYLLTASILLFLHLGWYQLSAQGIPYQGPEDPAGDVAALRGGYMNGNNTYLYYLNNTRLSNWYDGCFDQFSKWPNNINGRKMVDAISVMIGAQVFIDGDSIPIDSEIDLQNHSNPNILHFLQSSSYYNPRHDTNLDGTVDYTLQPVFGYFSELSEYPAMSNLPNSWPPGGWPSQGYDKKWSGEWNGRFGRGVKYADLESYFVANDAQDQEYLDGNKGPVRYYPRPGKYIGDILPTVSTQLGRPWGGLGIRIEQRGFQWNNTQARDVLFFEYSISNISDYNILETAFGYYLNTGIGDDGVGDDIGFWRTDLEMAYLWDMDETGRGGVRTGVSGLAFLESPGISWDGIDNDEDGLIDEKRDNEASQIIGPYDGITNLSQFLDYYGLNEDQLRDHWDADEDQDWRDGNDLNGNGIYDNGEDPGDDVGLDGVGPGELNYYGPDADGTECNHKPDFATGIGSEPNFALTDVSESDMLGLTSFHMFPNPPRHTEEYNFRGDQFFFEMMNSGELEDFTGVEANWIVIFASSPFPLYQGRTERISIANLYSYDELAGLSSSEHSAPSLFEKKRVTQFIYESDYRFAQPPKIPTLNAVAEDGRIVLTWDNVADKMTREPLLRGENDFEGYKLYKSSDKRFSDAEKLFDGFGNPIGKKPIFQCDLDNGINGFSDIAPVNGELFFLGNDTGIKHYFIDEDVQNGRTYYYGLVAYDHGIEGIELDIAPAENNVVIDMDEDENVRYVGQNVQVVTPYQKAAGYLPPTVLLADTVDTWGTGSIYPEAVSTNDLNYEHNYVVKFLVDTVDVSAFFPIWQHPRDILYTNTGFQVYDITNNRTLVYEENSDYFSMGNIIESTFNDIVPYHHFNSSQVVSDVFNSLRINIDVARDSGFAEYDPDRSGWLVGDAPITITPSSVHAMYFPWQYDIIFTSNNTIYQGQITSNLNIKDIDGSVVTNIIRQPEFNFYVVNNSFPDSSGNFEQLEMIVVDENNNGAFDISEDHIIVGHLVIFGTQKIWGNTVFSIDFKEISDSTLLPEPGDVYRIDFKRPFLESDSVLFSVQPKMGVDKNLLNDEMSNIKVVPNPYIATNAMEPFLSNTALNQRRLISFTNIPAECTIKIFSSSGVYIDEIVVQNPPDQGLVHWDLLSREGLEIAAGVYFYQVMSAETGKEKMGKFAVVK